MNTLRRWDLHQWLVQRPAERRYPQGSHRPHQLEDQRLSGKKESTSSPKQTQIKSGILTLLSGLTSTRVPIVKHGDESKRATPEVGLGMGRAIGEDRASFSSINPVFGRLLRTR